MNRSLLSPADAAPPFFVTGGTLPRDAPSYVERKADTELFTALSQGEFCYVLTARQMGKSSLMVRTATRLKRAGAAVASLDLTAVGQNLSAVQWYKGLLGRLGRQLDVEEALEARWRDAEGIGPLLRWSDTVFDTLLDRFDGPIVLFVDEIDAVRSLPFTTDEFFGAIRECYNRRALDSRYQRITFCLLGVASPSELISDPRMSPFNLGRRIELTDFTLSEALPLAHGLRGGRSALERVLHWTGGHPYLTQRICRAAEEDGARTLRDLDRLTARLFFGRDGRAIEDNLLFVQDRLLRADVDSSRLLTLYDRIRSGRPVTEESAGLLAETLRLSGVVRIDPQGRLRVRNRIYAHAFDRRWVLSHLGDAEQRRQRTAFRRGLSLAFAGSALVIATISFFAWQANSAERAARRAEQAARERQEHAEQLRFDATMNLAWDYYRSGDVLRAREQLADLRPVDKSRFEWQYLWSRVSVERGVLTGIGIAGTNALQFRPDGRTLLVADINAVRLWEPATRAIHTVQTIPNQGKPVSSVFSALSPDGKWALLVDTADSFFLNLMNLTTGRVQRLLHYTNKRCPTVAFSPNGKLIATADRNDGTVRVWSIGKSSPLWMTRLPPNRFQTASPTAIAFSPNNQTLAVGDRSGHIIFRNAGTGRVIEQAEQQGHSILALAYTQDGSSLAISSAAPNPSVRIWSLRHHRLDDHHFGGSNTMHLIFSKDGQMLALGSADHSVSLWETQTGIRRTTFKTDSTVSSLSLSPDGRVLAFGGPEEPARVLRIAPASEDQFPKPVAQQHYVPDLYPASIALSPDTRNVAQLDQLSIDHTQVLHAWDTATGKAIIPIQKATNVHFSHSFFAPDNRQLANTDDLWQVNDTFRVVDITTGKIKFWPRGPWGETFTAAFSPDNALLATGHNDVIRIWDIKADRQIRSLPYRGRAVRTLAFSPDARCIAVGGSGNSLDVFDVRSGKSVVTLQKKSDDRKQFVNALAFSRDGMVLATSNSGPPPSVQLWHCSPGATYQQMIPEVLHGNVGTVLALAVSPDGCTLATGGTSQMIHVWNTATGRETIRLPYRGNQVQCLAFAIDQRSLVAVDQSGQLYRWCISASK